MRGRHTPPAPLERGGWDACFLLYVRDLSMRFPSREGIKGCVMVRSVAWVELFFEVVSVGFGWMFLILGGYARTLHTPGPSQEGRF